MPVNSEQFSSRIQRQLPHVAFVAGDEPLLVLEAADAFRAAARKQGYEEREVLHVGTGFDWNDLATASASLSLFAARRRIELNMGGKGPGKEGSAALVEFAENPHDDVVLLVMADSLDKSARTSKWFKTIDKLGLLMYAWPIAGMDYVHWVSARLQAAGLRADQDVVRWLCARTEGNLLACKQEIEKLSLLCPGGILDIAAAEQAVSDHARFDAFDFVEKLMLGRATSALRSLWRLREEGEEPLSILGSVTWALRGLDKIMAASASGANMESAFRTANVWGTKRKAFETAARRLNRETLSDAIGIAGAVDLACKGMSSDSPWEELVKLTACLVQAPIPGVRPESLKLKVSGYR